MFNFTTTTLINSSDSYVVLDANHDSVAANQGAYTGGAEMQIRRGNLHIKAADAACYKAYKKAGHEGELAQTTVKITDGGVSTAGTEYRLKIYIKLEGSQNSYYANSTGFRGKPFYVNAITSATVNTAAKLAEALAKNAKKYMIMVYENATIDVANAASSDTITLTATDEFQRLAEVELQKWVPSASGAVDGEWVVAGATVTEVKRGEEGFGTYTHLMKDYRLPTAANTRWNRIVPDEAPVPGVLYDQFTVYMTKDRGIMGGHAVGQLATSTTCHVYFVQESLSADFKAALEGILGSGAVQNAPGTSDPIKGIISGAEEVVAANGD